MPSEAQIQADVEDLRQRVADTQDLYREVSALLFFRYGITPTANKLYQYVRKGSMSAPAEALAKFWDDLREKSRVRIEHPDLPDDLKSSAGELVAALWTRAQSAAHSGLEAFRSEAQRASDLARAAQDKAEQELQAISQTLSQSQGGLGLANDRILSLERELASERGTKDALGSELASNRRQREALEIALTEARQDFASELEKLREALKRSEERFEATEKRALLEIDRERTATTKVQKELAQFRESYEATNQSHREEVATLQSKLGEARQRVGVLEGAIQEIRIASDRQALELQATRVSCSGTETENALLRNELMVATSRVTALEDEIKEIRRSTVTREPIRKGGKKAVASNESGEKV